jgi:aminopeptidase N
MKKATFLLAMLLLPFWALQAQTPGEHINVNHYEIHVGNFDFANRTLQGETFVEFTATDRVPAVVLELKYLTVTEVDCDFVGVESFSQEGDFLTITFAEPIEATESATLDITYGGNTFSETWGGVEWWGNDYVYNLGVGFESQPHNLGKAWFPCVDNFTDKATYDVFITTTNDKKAICGGAFVETVDNGDGTSTWHWNTPQEIATYHISFVVGDFVLWEDVYHGIERDIPIEVYATPALSGRVEATFQHIHEIVAFFEENLGPYPFNRIGYISTSKGCMEHTDNIALATSVFSGNTSYEEYLAHELSHMWSGNKVTCAEAGDMWLNEGFAQFWGAFYELGVYGEESYLNTMATMVNSAVGWCNNEANWIPLNNMPLDMTYDSDAIYNRGAVIVNTMMNYMGRENFLAAMRQYFQEYAYQTATSEQLCEALTQYSGIDMHGFFDTFVYSSGMPHLYAPIKKVVQTGDQFEVALDARYQHIGDSHIGQGNGYDVTFIGPDFQLVTERVAWDGLHDEVSVVLDFEPLGAVGDIHNGWLDGKTQSDFMLKTTSTSVFARFKVQPETLTDSVYVSIENHLVGPYDDPLIPDLTLSTKHFWTVNRYDFGEATVTAMIDYTSSTENDIIHTANDSATVVYRRDASETWHEIAHSLYPGSTWRNGRIIIEDFQPGEYAVAVWDKEALQVDEILDQKKTMQLYPNPAEGDVRVTWSGKTDGQIRILSPEGKEMRRIDFAQSEGVDIATNGLPQGWCTVVRLGKDGNVIETEKLIIK